MSHNFFLNNKNGIQDNNGDDSNEEGANGTLGSNAVRTSRCLLNGVIYQEGGEYFQQCIERMRDDEVK